MQEIIKQLDALLKEGRTEEVIKQTYFLIDHSRNDFFVNTPLEENAEVCALRGMAYYRRKEFDEARYWFGRSREYDENNGRAVYGMAYLAAYVNKNPEETRAYMEKLPESAARDNAHMIIMRSEEYRDANGLLETAEEVYALFDKWMKPNPSDPLNVANLLHNVGRFHIVCGDIFAETSTDYRRDPYLQAIGTLSCAIALYGAGDTNLHHRAAANYWMSVAMEKLFGPAAAVPAIGESLRLWGEQVKLDPTNPHFIQSFNNTHQRVLEISEKVRELAAQSPGREDLKYLAENFGPSLCSAKTEE